jgi:small GTP-binding protein
MSAKYVIRVLTIGYTDVGKTSIILRFTKNQFNDKYVSTIGIDFKSKTLEIDKNSVKITVFDTAGQEKYKGIVKSFYNKANGILLTFDLSNKESFSRLDYWVEELKEHIASNELYILLVGNKKDKKEREVTFEEAQQYAENNNFGGYFEVSAKDGEGINEMFINVAKGSLKKILNKNEDENNTSIQLSLSNAKVSQQKNNKCC